MEETAEVTALKEEQQGEMEPPQRAQEEMEMQTQTQVPTARKFACKLCRCVLFTVEELADHEPERHQISTRRRIKDAKHASSGAVYVDACSSFFLEEVLPWMDEALLAEGKIHCPTPKCHARLGALQWSGSQCSCGTWVTPSIKITKSRVDPIHEVSSAQIVTGVMLPHVVTPPVTSES